TPTHPVKGEGMVFYAPEEVIIAIEQGGVSKHAYIKVKVEQLNDKGERYTSLVETVAGRIIFNQYVPKELGFVNELLTSKKLQRITAEVYRKVDTARTAQFLDDIKTLGYKSVYEGGITMALEDVQVPKVKSKLIEQAKKEIDQVWNNYLMGLITDNERYN